MATTQSALQLLDKTTTALLERLDTLIQDQHAARAKLEAEHFQAHERLRDDTRERIRTVLREHEAAAAQARQQHETLQQELQHCQRQYLEQFKALKQALKQRYRQYHRRVEQATKSYREVAWESGAIHEATKAGVQSDLETYGNQVDQLCTQAGEVRRAAMEIAAQWSLAQLVVPTYRPEPAETAAKLRTELAAATERASQQLHTARHWPRLGTSGLVSIALGQLVAAAGAITIALLVAPLAGVFAFFFLAPLVGGLFYLAHWFLQRRRVRQLLTEALMLAAWVEENGIACVRMMQLEGQQRIQRDAQRHRQELKRLKSRLRDELAAARHDYRQAAHTIQEKHILPLRKLQSKILTLQARLDGYLDQALAKVRAERRAALEAARRQHRERQAALTDAHHKQSHALRECFQRELQELQASVARLWRDVRSRFPDWATFAAHAWTPPRDPARYLLLGQIELDLVRDFNAAADWFNRPEERLLVLPALVPLPLPAPLLLNVGSDQKRAAVTWQRTLAARYLQAVPPGRFTLHLFDPAFLGDPFAGLMHLADYDRRLVAGRIWSEPRLIDEQLGLLQQQLETVIQVLLRDRFETLREYNQQAGQVAEPFRLVLLTDCPDGLAETALQKLHAVAVNAPRCGVSIVALRAGGEGAEEPQAAHRLGPFASVALPASFRDGSLWLHNALADRSIRIRLEAAPPTGVLTELVHRVGELSVDALRVEVPMQQIAPPAERWWKGSTHDGLEVPLGVVGAGQVQYLRLGKGTAQHVLVAGRTGSGKSNLLHVLITAAALQYSPRELLLYLVDFKKGVEFKAYAAYDLPQACVVAIESEREFGLSVLQQLDREMQRRGELFRAAGVQDLPAFRHRRPEEPMPRILLVVDEFQEFFVEDDQIAQQASLLLDRLVRQGRAFGIHVLLGSQTLSGAYALARSTVSQMGVRIALQCSEGDAHLILSEDNPAARLLSRPGEAIYNDANGLVEGNQRFQIAWLPALERDRYLKQVRGLAERHGLWRPGPLQVFEGNLPAELGRNERLQRCVAAPWAPAERVPPPTLWLGESVAIPQPVAVVLEPQAGKNLLLVGQDPASAAGVLAACILSAAVQCPPPSVAPQAGMRIYVLDEAPPERSARPLWHRLRDQLPHEIVIVPKGEVDSTIAQLWQQLHSRDDGNGTKTLLIFYDLGRFRSLRAEEELFSFAESTVSADRPDRQFRTLYEQGPEAGMHVIAWSDTLANVQRCLGRSGLREFGLRVAFQMGANDSTTLIDSPNAAKLGVHRALLYDEERGVLEKFRPYGTPDDETLADLARRILRRYHAGAAR